MLTNSQSRVFHFIAIVMCCFCASCNNQNSSQNTNNLYPPDVIVQNQSNNTRQIIMAINNRGMYTGLLWGLELINEQWNLTFDTIPCSFGKNGISDHGQKTEGDGKTPSGTFSIGSAFGYQYDIDTKMNFIELFDNHYWVSDTSSELYNQLVDYFPEDLYVEKMKRDDHLYKYGIIINYNIPERVKGKGSAIFIHIERRTGAPTAGCIAISEQDIIELMSWVDPDNKTIIAIFNSSH